LKIIDEVKLPIEVNRQKLFRNELVASLVARGNEFLKKLVS
jgi:hypothetical protein